MHHLGAFTLHAWLVCAALPGVALPGVALPGVAPPRPADDYAAAREVIERRCLPCHGGDARRSELSFADHRTFARGGARGAVIDVGDLAKSRLLAVVDYRDPSLAMPPDGVIPEAEREALRRWVLAGAAWPADESGALADAALHPVEDASHGGRHATVDDAWWAYEPLLEPPVPIPPDGGAIIGWDVHPVDGFVGVGLAERGLAPAERATPEALLRRASFDLTGLPPTVDERERFLASVDADGFDAAWLGWIDELQARPQYGEAQARHWLDLVRYAETNGYERDSIKRNVWRYRDWVIRAYNADLPYDRFVQYQIAGDEYAPGMDDPHDASEARLATGFHRLGVWDDEPVDRPQALSDERADIVDTLSQVVFGTTMGCARCHDHKADPITQKEYYSLTAHFRGIAGFRLDAHRPVADRPADGVLTAFEHAAALVALDARIAESARVLGLSAPDEGDAPKVLVADARGGAIEWSYRHGEPSGDWAAPGYDDSWWPKGKSGFGAPGTPGAIVGTPWHTRDIQLRTTFRLEALPRALQVSLHHDEDAEVYLNGTLVLKRSGYRQDYGDFQLDRAALDALVVGRNVLAVACKQSAGGQYIDVGLRSGFDPDAEGSWLTLAQAAAAERADDPAYAALRALLVERETLVGTPVAEPYPAQVVYEHSAHPEPQHVELRGSVHALGDRVEPGLPAAWLRGAREGARPYALEPPPEGATSSLRRRALAEWAFDGGAHVTARVEANRVWQFLFGRGLCRTPGDFGRLGERPTDVELLDRVAIELVELGWSRKALQRWLMQSRTYQMASVGDPDALALDPRNDAYWRFDPRRLTAEEYRDAALATSGELVSKSFGPWVFPPLAQEVLATSSRPGAAWGRSSDEDAVRRSIYVHVKRSLREPLLSALDQPDPDLPCAARFPTNVPTQALLTLNGDFVRGRAQALAASLVAEHEGLDERVGAAIQRTLGRSPEPAELERARRFHDELVQEHGQTDEGAFVLYCLGLFNRNEFLWLD